jgi:hypothetical protein
VKVADPIEASSPAAAKPGATIIAKAKNGQ